MAFRTSTAALPRMTTYDDAAYIEGQITPIRGRSPEVKPLGKRSNDNVLIRRNQNEVIVSMYRTDILRYEKMDDGQTMIRICSGGYATQSTVAVIGHILGVHACLRGGSLWISLSGLWYALHRETNYTLKVTTNGLNDFTPVDYVPPMVTKMDKKKLDAVRKQYKAFKLYMRRMCKVLASAEGWITDIPVCWGGSTDRVLAYARYEGEGEPDEATLQNFYMGMVHLMNATTRWEWVNYERAIATNYKSMYNKLEGYIKNHHHNEVTYKERYNNKAN